MGNNESTTKFKADISELKAEFQQAQRQIRVLNSEFKASSAALDDWSSDADGLNAKLKQLNGVLDAEKTKLSALEKQYRLVAQEQGENSKGAQELLIKINNQKAAISKTEKEIDKYTNKLDEIENSADDAGKAVKDLSDAAKDSGDGFTIAKGAIAGFIANGLTALAGAAKNAISSIVNLAGETREYRNEMAKLDTAFESAGFSTDTAAASYKELYGIIGDEGAATEAAQQLAKISKNEKDLEANTRILTGVMGEYGTSIPTEGLAEGMAATAAMGEVQGVLADALEWQGVNLDDYNEKLGTMSTEEERAAYIQKTLTDLYGDSADKFRENNAAVIEANEATAALTETQAQLGAKIEPITTKVKQGFAEVLAKILELVDGADFTKLEAAIDKGFSWLIETALPAVKTGFQWVLDNKDTLIAGIAGIAAGFAAFNVANMIMGVVKAFKAFKAAQEGATVAQWLLNVAMNANPIGLIVAAIAGLVTAFVVLWKKCDSFREFWQNLGDAIIGVWKKAVENVKKGIAAIVDFFVNLGSAISGVWAKAVENVKKGIDAIVNFFTKTIPNALNNFIKWWASGFEQVKKTVQNVTSAIGKFFSDLWQKITSTFASIAAWFSDKFTAAKNGIYKAFSTVVNFFSNIWKRIKGAFANVGTWFKNAFSSAVSGIKNAFSKVGSFFSDVWAGIKKPFSNVASWFKETFSKAWAAVKNVFSSGGKIFDGIKEGIASTFKTVVNGLIGGINKVIAVPFKAINTALKKIRDISIFDIEPFKNKISLIDVPQIPLLEKGGVLKRGQVGLLEGNGAEAVVPLENNTGWLDEIASRLSQRIGFAGGAYSAGYQSAPNVVNNFYQTNNSPKALDRLEVYRQTKNLLKTRG